MTNKVGKWAAKVGLKAAGTFGLVLVGGITAAVTTGGITGIFAGFGDLLEIAGGAAMVKVLIPAATNLLKRAETVEPGPPPQDVFGSITD